MVTPSPAFVPVLLKGMTIHPDDPLRFDFIIDSGNTQFTADEVKKESERLVKYFLAAMTVPKDDLWVNLSPNEPQRIIPDELGKTELGRDMLAQDYILKQLTASLMYPEEELGKKFWDKVYKEAQERFGTSEIPVNTFNKVWIVPETATVYEHGQTVYVVNAYLKVMLDEDYMDREASSVKREAVETSPRDTIHEIRDTNVSSEIIREIILPAIEREVNQGAHFAPLRQIYHSLILAKWYKETIKNSLLSQVYADKNLIDGVNVDDPAIKDKVYAQYMEAYKKGVFNYIKEDYVAMDFQQKSMATSRLSSEAEHKRNSAKEEAPVEGDRLSREMIPRKYFSGGLSLDTDVALRRTGNPVVGSGFKGDGYTAAVSVMPQKDGASSPITDDKAEAVIKNIIGREYHYLIGPEQIRQVRNSNGNYKVILEDDKGAREGKVLKIFTMPFNPLQALKDDAIFNVFNQIIERRYDVRVLDGKYGLGKAPDFLTFKDRKVTYKEFAYAMTQYLLDHADQNPYEVADNFREEFLKDGPPLELKPIFDKYMQIKPEVFDLATISDLIPTKGNMADIGAGHNVLGKKILEYSDNNGLQVRYMVGTDINEWQDEWDRQDERLSFVYQDSPVDFPLSANSYDAVVVKWVLHHMSLDDQRAFLKDIERILKPGGRLIVFESLGASQQNQYIWNDYAKELKNGVSWGPAGEWRAANLKLNRDFKKLTEDQQRRLHALEDYFGHNVVMNRYWMPQPFTYRTVSEFQILLKELGFTENEDIRRVYGSAPFIRMGPPSVRLVFEKNKTPITLIKGDGGHNKAMVLINGVTAEEQKYLKNIFGVLVYQDKLRKDLEKERLDDIVIFGNERLDTFEEALQLLNRGIGRRIVILGGYGIATIPLIDLAIEHGFEIKISMGVFANKQNWREIKAAITEDTRKNIIQYSEADIIKQIIVQILEGWPSEYQNIIKKIENDGLENVIITEGRSVFTRRLLVNYRTMLDKEGAFERVGGHKVVFLQKPHLQLRAKAAFDELFAAELQNHKVSTISHTVSYDNLESERLSVFRDVVREAWRLVLYSDYGRAYINLRRIYSKGVDGIPQNFWYSINYIFNALEEKERQVLARELMQLIATEGLSVDEIIREDNLFLKTFVENVRNTSESSQTNLLKSGAFSPVSVVIDEMVFPIQGGNTLKAEITKIDLSKAKVDLYVDEGVLQRDFYENPPVIGGDGMGLTMGQLVSQDKDRDNLLVAFNGAQPHWESILLHVKDGRLITKVPGAKGLDEKKYSPVNGEFWFLSLGQDHKELDKIKIRNNQMQLPEGLVLNNAIAGVPLIINGENVVREIGFHNDEPVFGGRELRWPQTREMAMSAIGYNTEGQLVRVAVFEDITIHQFMEILMQNKLRNAILLGTSADVKTYENLTKLSIRIAKPRKDSYTARKNLDVERPLGTYITVHSIESEKRKDQSSSPISVLGKSADVSMEALRELGLPEEANDLGAWFSEGHRPSALYHDLDHSLDVAGAAYVLAKARGLTDVAMEAQRADTATSRAPAREQALFLYRVGLLHDFDPHRDKDTPARVSVTLQLLEDDFNREKSLDDGQAGWSVLQDQFGWGEKEYLMAAAFIARSEHPFEFTHDDPAYKDISPVAQYENLLKEIAALDRPAARFVVEWAPFFSEYADKSNASLIGGIRHVVDRSKALAVEFFTAGRLPTLDKDKFAADSYKGFFATLGQESSFVHDKEIAAKLGFTDVKFLTLEDALAAMPAAFRNRFKANAAAAQTLGEAYDPQLNNFDAALAAAETVYRDTYDALQDSDAPKATSSPVDPREALSADRDTSHTLAGTASPRATQVTNDEPGGIDMNDINVNRQGAGVDIQFDPVEIQAIIDEGITGFAPVIINITPLPSVLPLLGLAPNKEEELEMSSLN